MTDDVDVITRRGPGRPPKQSVSLGIPVYSRRSLELEEERLSREEAALQERRNLLLDKIDKQRTRCAMLFGEGLLRLAESDTTCRDVCVSIVSHLEKADDRILLESWIPEVKSPASAVSPTPPAKELPQSVKKPERRSTPVKDAMAAGMPCSSVVFVSNNTEVPPNPAQEGLDLVSPSNKTKGAKDGE